MRRTEGDSAGTGFGPDVGSCKQDNEHESSGTYSPPISSLPRIGYINPYPTAFPYGNGMVLHFYQQQESSTTKTVHKVINKGLKTYV